MADDVQIDELLLMGRVWRAHGLDGEVKVIPETDDPARFEDLAEVSVGRTAGTARSLGVEGVRYQSNKKGPLVILKLEGVDDRDEAERMRQFSVFVQPDDLPPLEEDEVFLHDLVGLQAVRQDGSVIGSVDDVLELPGQDLLVIAREGLEPAMVPAVPEFLTEIDLEAGRVVVRPIEGLLEE